MTEYVPETKCLKLTYNDSLFSGTYTIKHHSDEYQVDPGTFLKYSRKFASKIDFNGREINAGSDNYDRETFSLFVDACQGRPIQLDGVKSVNLLLLAEDWEAPTLVLKIEEIIKNTIAPSQILELYTRLIDTGFPIQRLEKIMVCCLHKYILEPAFPLLPYDVLNRVVHSSIAKIDADKIVKLCYEVSKVRGLQALSVFNDTSFDDLLNDEFVGIKKLFTECPYEGLAPFFKSMSVLLGKIPENANARNIQAIWRRGERENWDVAYRSYKEISKKMKEQYAEQFDIGADEVLPKYRTAERFLKIAADKGKREAQLEYGKLLLERARSPQDRASGVRYLIQSVGEGHSDAIPALKPYLPLNFVPTIMKAYTCAVITLQNILLSLNPGNLDNSLFAIYCLPFGNERDGIQVLTSNILRAVLVRQRNIDLYVAVVNYLMKNARDKPEGEKDGNNDYNNYSYLKSSIFTKVVGQLITPEPRARQFVLMHFLYRCSQYQVFDDDELCDSLLEFIRNFKDLTHSLQIIFFYFAPLIESKNKEIYKMLYLQKFDGGFGCLDSVIKQFKDDFVDLRKNEWERFREKRQTVAHSTDLGMFIANDDIGKFETYVREHKIDLTLQIPNDIYEIPTVEETDEITLLEYACLQGSEKIFGYLFQRGAVSTNETDYPTIVCAIIGQSDFICDIIAKKYDNKGELFRLAAEHENVMLLASLLRDDAPINDPDENGRTPFHHAVAAGLADTVKIIMSLDTCDLNAQDANGYTALHIAAQNDDEDMVKILVYSRSININCRTHENELPYDLAKNNEKVKKLLKRK